MKIMKTDKRQLIIDASYIDQNSLEALEDFAELYSDLPIGKLIKEWLYYNAYEWTVWYVGEDA